MTATCIMADGIRYSVRRSGDGTGLLLLHGFTGSAAEWEPFRSALERGTSPVAVDLLGHGASDRPADPARHAVERQAADLAALLRAEGIAPAHAAGYSMGARIALRLAIDHPDAVRSVVLESPSAGLDDPADRIARRDADEALASLLETEGIAAFVDRWEALPLFATERALPVEERVALRASRLANDPGALAASLRGAGQGAMGPMQGGLSRIDVPTTVIAGALDTAGVARARSVAEGIAGARLVVIDRAGHAPHREAPAAFVRTLAGHLARTSDACVIDSPAAIDHPTPAAVRSRP